MTRRTGMAALLAAHVFFMAAFAAPSPALAMQLLEAAVHAELAAEISATGVNRIVLEGDRISKEVRAPDGFAVEHDAASADLYLRPAARRAKIPASGADPHAPVTLFIGTEKGFTYRLTLTPADRDSAQILIRNADAGRTAVFEKPAAIGGSHIAALVRLVRSVARRVPLPGYAIHAASRQSLAGFTLIETWRGPRSAAHVLEADRSPSASAADEARLAGTLPSRPRNPSLAALVGGDARVIDAHDQAVARTLGWFERNVAETRMKDPDTGRMARTGG